MKYVMRTAATLFSLALIAAIATGAYYVFKLVTILYAKLDVQIAPTVGFASLIILGSALTVASGIREARKRAREQQLVRDKAALYERLIHVLVAAHDGDLRSLEQGVALQDLERSLALRAGPAVLKAYHDNKKLRASSDASGPDLHARLAAMLVEMRKDLGLSNKGIKSEELIQTILGTSRMEREGARESTRLSCEEVGIR